MCLTTSFLTYCEICNLGFFWQEINLSPEHAWMFSCLLKPRKCNRSMSSVVIYFGHRREANSSQGQVTNGQIWVFLFIFHLWFLLLSMEKVYTVIDIQIKYTEQKIYLMASLTLKYELPFHSGFIKVAQSTSHWSFFVVRLAIKLGFSSKWVSCFFFCTFNLPCSLAKYPVFSGHNGTQGKLEVGQVKSDVSMGTEECLLPPSHVGYRQSFVSRIGLFVLN